MTAISAEPRWGLAAGSTRGLLGKILLLGFVAAIAVAMAIPLAANEEWLWLAVLGLVTARDLRRLHPARGTSRSSTSSRARSS